MGNAANVCKVGSTLVFSSKQEVQNEANDWEIQAGDLMYFVEIGKNNPAHAAIVSKVESNDILYACHSYSYFDKSLSGVISKYKEVRIIRLK